MEVLQHKPLHFGIGDYLMFIALFVVSLLIGFFFSKKGKQSSDDFLLGGRGMGVIPVSLSLTASSISAISLLGSAGEVYSNGVSLILLTVGSLFGLLTATYLFVPVFYELQITSINEYISIRFNSHNLRIIVMLIGMFKTMTYTGICLYAPTVALSSVTPLETNTYLWILGIICTAYSTMGGIKAVVWTDVFQTIVMFLGVIAVITITTVDAGGISEVVRISTEGGRTDIFNFDFHPHVRHNVLNLFLLGFTFKIAIFGTSQIYLQRICSVSSYRDAKRVAYTTCIGQILIFSMVYYSGMCAYVTYYDCDPISAGRITSKDQIMPFLVMDKLNYFFLPGLFVSTVFSGALSSLSSLINACSAILWIDVCQNFTIFQNASDRTATFVNKLLSVLIGGMMIGVGFLAKQLGGLIQAAMTVGGVSSGPLLGLFFIGTCIPPIGHKAAGFGLIGSWLLMIWVGIGGYIYRAKHPSLAMSMQGCEILLNTTSIISNDTSSSVDSNATISTQILNVTKAIMETNSTNFDEHYDFPLMAVYNISYTWYPICGLILCMCLSFLGHLVVGRDDYEVPIEALAVPLQSYYRRKRLEIKSSLNSKLEKYSEKDSYYIENLLNKSIKAEIK